LRPNKEESLGKLGRKLWIGTMGHARQDDTYDDKFPNNVKFSLYQWLLCA